MNDHPPPPQLPPETDPTAHGAPADIKWTLQIDRGPRTISLLQCVMTDELMMANVPGQVVLPFTN